jgi:hypothetical protein
MACDLQIISITPTPPTSPGGLGYVTVTYSTSSSTPAYVQAVDKATGGIYANSFADKSDDKTGVLYGLPVGNYDIIVGLPDNTECEVRAPFTMPPFAAVDTSLSDAPRWEPVGGVLPNPVLLKVEASLLTAGVARAGLHVEVELLADGKVFATFRATVRTATQYVDAAPYLRAQLVALQRYAATATAPLIDKDAVLRFSYRYRVVDKAGAEAWQPRARERYGVLAALPQAADTMAPYVADGTGKVASVFDDYEATQFVGLPLEASVLLPPYTSTPRWAELRYLDAYGNPVEIRSSALANDLAAGMLRIPLPNDPPLCAVAVEVSIRDDNRAFPSTCGHVIPTPPASTRGTYQDPIIGLF